MVILVFIKSFTMSLKERSCNDCCFDGSFSLMVCVHTYANTTLCLMIEKTMFVNVYV